MLLITRIYVSGRYDVSEFRLCGWLRFFFLLFFLSPGAVESIKMLVEFFGGVFFFLFSNSGD